MNRKIKRTPAEIAQEVKTIREMKPKIRQHTAFGDDNHASIDAQVNVLDNGLTEDQVYSEYGEDDGESIVMAALDALFWLEGSKDNKPSEDWASLVKVDLR
jgi:hypothetical protein